MKTDLLSTSNCGNQALSLFGFGAVCEKGFGLGYIIKDNCVNVNITSFVKGMDKLYLAKLNESLVEIRQLLERNSRNKSSNSSTKNAPTLRAKL